ncbi:hypothetical protein HDU81_011286 [Chytriomyces hyalinus]|nr:hypothetical protein HDU81_011286 [Chytriomyces hyalinus]
MLTFSNYSSWSRNADSETTTVLTNLEILAPNERITCTSENEAIHVVLIDEGNLVTIMLSDLLERDSDGEEQAGGALKQSRKPATTPTFQAILYDKKYNRITDTETGEMIQLNEIDTNPANTKVTVRGEWIQEQQNKVAARRTRLRKGLAWFGAALIGWLLVGSNSAATTMSVAKNKNDAGQEENGHGIRGPSNLITWYTCPDNPIPTAIASSNQLNLKGGVSIKEVSIKPEDWLTKVTDPLKTAASNDLMRSMIETSRATIEEQNQEIQMLRGQLEETYTQMDSSSPVGSKYMSSAGNSLTDLFGDLWTRVFPKVQAVNADLVMKLYHFVSEIGEGKRKRDGTSCEQNEVDVRETARELSLSLTQLRIMRDMAIQTHKIQRDIAKEVKDPLKEKLHAESFDLLTEQEIQIERLEREECEKVEKKNKALLTGEGANQFSFVVDHDLQFKRYIEPRVAVTREESEKGPFRVQVSTDNLAQVSPLGAEVLHEAAMKLEAELNGDVGVASTKTVVLDIRQQSVISENFDAVLDKIDFSQKVALTMVGETAPNTPEKYGTRVTSMLTVQDLPGLRDASKVEDAKETEEKEPEKPKDIVITSQHDLSHRILTKQSFVDPYFDLLASFPSTTSSIVQTENDVVREPVEVYTISRGEDTISICCSQTISIVSCDPMMPTIVVTQTSTCPKDRLSENIQSIVTVPEPFFSAYQGGLETLANVFEVRTREVLDFSKAASSIVGPSRPNVFAAACCVLGGPELEFERLMDLKRIRDNNIAHSQANDNDAIDDPTEPIVWLAPWVTETERKYVLGQVPSPFTGTDMFGTVGVSIDARFSSGIPLSEAEQKKLQRLIGSRNLIRTDQFETQKKSSMQWVQDTAAYATESVRFGIAHVALPAILTWSFQKFTAEKSRAVLNPPINQVPSTPVEVFRKPVLRAAVDSAPVSDAVLQAWGMARGIDGQITA